MSVSVRARRGDRPVKSVVTGSRSACIAAVDGRSERLLTSQPAAASAVTAA